MNLKNMSNENLFSSTKKAADDERRALSTLLHFLREVDRRRLFSQYRCESMQAFMEKFLGYSHDEARVRLAAMRLLKELPELEAKINDGSLSLTNMLMVQRTFIAAETAEQKSADTLQTLFASEEIPPARPKYETKEAKLALVAKIENKSKAEAVRVLQKELGQKLVATEVVREMDNDQFELKITMTKAEFSELKRLKDMRAHEPSAKTYSKLINCLVRESIAKHDPLEKAKRAEARQQKETSGASSGPVKNENVGVPEPAAQSKRRAYLPAALRRAVWLKSNYQCEICSSKRALQIDHIIVVAQGGSDEIDNLRLLCRSCNQARAIAVFGPDHMQRFLL